VPFSGIIINMPVVEIDGSYGEGGGQVLRTALALSALLKKPLRLYNIRGGRRRPGLMAQHLCCVRSLAELTGARLRGDALGSQELHFEPGPTRWGSYSFDIGTAGATSLLVQALLPPLAFAGGESRLQLCGGTHVPMSPPFEFLAQVLLPTLAGLGLQARAQCRQWGFYPQGGGLLELSVQPASCVQARDFTQRGSLLGLEGVSAVARLPLGIAQRQRDALLEAIAPLEAHLRCLEVPSPGPGTYVFLLARYEGALAGFSALGARGKPAEVVGQEAAQAFLQYQQARGALEPHLADQLVLYLALAEAPVELTTTALSSHLLTNLWVIGRFLPLRYETEGQPGGPGRVRLQWERHLEA